MLNGFASALLPSAVTQQIRNRPLLRRLLGNSAWQLSDKVCRMGGAVLVGAYVARYLGPSQLGLLAYATALATLVSAIAQFGQGSVVVRDLIARPQDRPAILASSWLLRLCGALGAIVLSLVLSLLLRPGDERSAVVVLLIACMAFPQAWDVIDYDYQSRIDARSVVVARNLSFLILSAGRVLLVLLRAPLPWFALALSGETALSAVLLARAWRKAGWRVPLSAVDWSELRLLAVVSWPLVIAGLSTSVYMRIDQVMLGRMLDNADVGLFAAAVRISEALYFLPLAIAASVAPALTAAHARSTPDYEHRFVKVTRLLVWAAIAVATCFTLFSRPIILGLYGARFAGAAAVLSIHTWGGVLVSLGVCSNLWLVNEGHLKYTMYQTLLGAATNFALNLFLIPRLGVIGAAVASCAGYFVAVTVTIAVLPKTRRLFYLQLASLVPLPLARG